MKKITCFIFFITVFLSFLNGDYYFRYTFRMEVIPKNKSEGKRIEKKEFVELWLGSTYFTLLTKENQMLADFNKGMEYEINHKKKTYKQEKINKYKEREKSTEEYNQVTKNLNSYVEIKPINESRRIGEWLCDGFIIKSKESSDPEGDVVFELWVSKDVNFDFSLLYNMYEHYLSGKPTQSERIIGEILKLFEDRGFPVEIKMTSYFKNTEIFNSLRAEDISEKKPPEWVYKVPENYKIYVEPKVEPGKKVRKKGRKRRRR